MLAFESFDGEHVWDKPSLSGLFGLSRLFGWTRQTK
jgi:hypothetical protein